jgi:hypothetical protein
MATVNAIISRHADDIVEFVWNLSTADVDGSPIGPNHGNFADRTFQVSGTWGGATFQWQGSNDGTTWFMLNDPFGVDLTASANALYAVAEGPLYMRPMLTVPGSGASLVVRLVARKQRSGLARG